MTTKKALVVDDSKLAQFVLKNMLVQHKVEVHTAESAEEALGYLSHEKPDVIFMDHTMPGMDGLEALKVIKDNPDTATIPVMMYTSQSDGVYVNQAKALGATDILPKQLKPIELQQVLKKLHLISDTSASQTSSTEPKTQSESNNESSKQKQATTASEIEELSKLLREAEAALEKETLKQFVQQELEKQHRRSTNILQKINHGLNELNYAKKDTKSEARSSRTAKLSVWLWPLLLLTVILIFGLLYFQLQQSLSSLQQAYTDDSANVIEQTPSQLNSTEIVSDPVDRLLEDIVKTVNTDNSIALDKPLLGTESMQRIASLVVPLNNAAFTGDVQVIAHTGNFCVINNDVAGERIIATDDTPISECRFSKSSIPIRQMMTEEFRNFIEGINDNKDNSFHITVDSHGGEEPLINYPDINTVTTAGEWNAIAQQNRRVEIVLGRQK